MKDLDKIITALVGSYHDLRASNANSKNIKLQIISEHS